MTKPEKNLAVLFAFFTVCCVLSAHLTQARYKTAVILTCLIWVYFAWQFSAKKTWQVYRIEDERRFFIVLLAAGTLVRFMVSIAGYGNYDSVSWEIVGSILERGGNVYNETTRYNTSPFWFWILGGIKKIAAVGSFLSYRSWVRILLSLVDLLTVLLLWRTSRSMGVHRVVATTLFYLNPVSLLLSSYHAQFENVAVLFLVMGLASYSSSGLSTEWRKRALWIFVTLGVVAKHNICYELPIALRFAYGKLRNWILLFVLSCLTFFASFALYWRDSYAAIVKNVLLYGSYPMPYGISTFVEGGHLKFIFLGALFLYAFVQRSHDLVIRCLQGVLFFLCFTPGFGHQYLALPVALGALRPSKPFFLYTVVASLVLMGSDRNIYIQTLSWIPLNAVWLAVLIWFISHLFSLHRADPKV